MFEFIVAHKREECESCGKHKTVGEFDMGRISIYLCCACLDNASRLIANKADKLYFDRDTGKFINLYKEDIQAWEKLYPNVDVIWIVEIAMPRWLASKTGLKKSKKSNWKNFLHNWLKREQMKAVGVM